MISRRRVLGLRRPSGLRLGLRGSAGGTLTFAAFSSPTSISTLIVSSSLLRVRLFHLPNRTREVRASLVEPVERQDLVVVGTRQGILGGNHFDVVGYPGLETIASLADLFLCQINAEIGHLNFATGRIEIEQRGFHVEGDLIAQISLLLLEFLHFQAGFYDFGANAAAGKEREIDACLILVSRDDVID